jgi:hypothetical protein
LLLFVLLNDSKPYRQKLLDTETITASESDESDDHEDDGPAIQFSE